MEKILTQPKATSTLGDEAAIISLLDEVVQCFSTGDIDRAISLHTDNVVLMESNMPLIEGKEAMRKFFSNFFKELKNRKAVVELDFSIAEMEIILPRAFVRGHVVLTKTENGMAPVQTRGKFFCLFAKQADGRWLRSHIISNSDGAEFH
jgi:ketosteroid isomerase-like protein